MDSFPGSLLATTTDFFVFVRILIIFPLRIVLSFLILRTRFVKFLIFHFFNLFFFGLISFGLYYIGLVASYQVVRGEKKFDYAFVCFAGEGDFNFLLVINLFDFFRCFVFTQANCVIV